MKTKLLLTFITSSLLLLGCDSDDKKEKEENTQSSGNLTLSFKQSSTGEAEYLLQENNLLSGEISAQGSGNEQQGWNFYYTVGNTLFASGYESKETSSYTLGDDKKIKKLNTFISDIRLEMFGNVDNTSLLAADLPRADISFTRNLYVVSAKTGKITSKHSITIEGKRATGKEKGWVPAPYSLLVRDNKLFVAFHKLGDTAKTSSDNRTPYPNEAVVAVFDYPLTGDNAATPIKVIKDTRTSMIGVNGNATNMIQTESGDIYSFSNGSKAAGFDPASDKPSGILRIKKGATDFDPDYFFNIEQATNGGKVFWMDKIGNNKALARIMTVNEEAEKAWYSASSKNFFTLKLALIDFEAKTVSFVKDLPLHQKRYTSPIEVINGKVYLSIETKESSHIYEYDIATNTAKKGAKILGKTVKGIYDLGN